MKALKLIVVLLVGIALLVSGCTNKVSIEEQEKLKTIIDEVKPLMEDWKGPDVFAGPVKGRCLIWWIDEDRLSAAYWKLPNELRAKSSDSEITVFLVSEVGYTRTWTLGNPSRPSKTVADIYVIYWPEKKPAGSVTLIAKRSYTPARAPGQESYIVPYIADWVKKLPRE